VAPPVISPQQEADIVLEVIRTRRVVRRYTDEPVADEQIRRVLEAGRWATTGGNRRIHRFLVIRDPKTIRLIKLISPGMLGAPTGRCRHPGDEHDGRRARTWSRLMSGHVIQSVRHEHAARTAADRFSVTDGAPRPSGTAQTGHATWGDDATDDRGSDVLGALRPEDAAVA